MRESRKEDRRAFEAQPREYVSRSRKIIIIKKKEKKKKKHVYLHIHTASDHYSVVRSAPPFIQWGTIYLLKNNAQQFDQRRISFVIFLKDYRAIVLVS